MLRMRPVDARAGCGMHHVNNPAPWQSLPRPPPPAPTKAPPPFSQKALYTPNMSMFNNAFAVRPRLQRPMPPPRPAATPCRGRDLPPAWHTERAVRHNVHIWHHGSCPWCTSHNNSGASHPQSTHTNTRAPTHTSPPKKTRARTHGPLCTWARPGCTSGSPACSSHSRPASGAAPSGALWPLGHPQCLPCRRHSSRKRSSPQRLAASGTLQGIRHESGEGRGKARRRRGPVLAAPDATRCNGSLHGGGGRHSQGAPQSLHLPRTSHREAPAAPVRCSERRGGG